MFLRRRHTRGTVGWTCRSPILDHAADVEADLVVVGRSRGLQAAWIDGPARPSQDDQALLVIPSAAHRTSPVDGNAPPNEAVKGDFGGTMLKRQLVLVAVDHTTNVERTMEAALGTAKVRGADVHVIHVVPHRAVPVGDRADIWSFEPHDERSLAIGARLASMPRSADHDGVRVRRVTLRGEPAHVIPAWAQLHDASVLVVERDYGSSRFWRNGRVVDAMARRSPIPLLVLPKRRPIERDESAPRRILMPFDFSIASAVALRTAVSLARRHEARITLLHTLNDVPGHMVFSGSAAWAVVRRLPAQKAAVRNAFDAGRRFSGRTM